MTTDVGGGAEIEHIELKPPLSERFRLNARDFPYWFVAIVAILTWMAVLIVTDPKYDDAWRAIIPGLTTTISATLYGFAFALVLGLIAGLGRISRNVVARNVAITYIEFIRGVPILVLLFTTAYVLVPQLSSTLGFENSSISFFPRAVFALALIYGAYLAEVFRAGIESVPRGQTEAGRSLGMSHAQTMRKIVLPQAVRNMTPAIGNDLIAMLKDSSLLSVLAVREISQEGRLFASATFQFRPTYVVLTFLYLSMTLILSLLLRWYRHRLGLDGA
jgi:polar amino acid transport system permease protein